MEMTDLTNKQSTTPIKYEGRGFWFEIGIILAIRMMNSLNYYTEELISRK